MTFAPLVPYFEAKAEDISALRTVRKSPADAQEIAHETGAVP